jgi:hypothetical protein
VKDVEPEILKGLRKSGERAGAGGYRRTPENQTKDVSKYMVEHEFVQHPKTTPEDQP